MGLKAASRLIWGNISADDPKRSITTDCYLVAGID
jgi:hypothetical protein